MEAHLSPLHVLVTGANGFVGGEVCRAVLAAGHRVRAAVRTVESAWAESMSNGTVVAVGDIGAGTDWTGALESIDVVIHLAARVHVMREAPGDAQARFREVNVLGSRCLAEASARAGVRRLVFVSSIKVNGEATTLAPFREQDPPRPSDAYALSKWEAEEALRAVARRSGLEVTIVRPPLVYGPGVRGNLAVLLRAIRRGVPLPFAGIDNRRSLLGRANLADLLLRCAESAAAAGETFLACDGEDVSTPDLIRRLAAGMRTRPRLFPLPAWAVAGVATVAGRKETVARLWGSLQVDASKARERLAWRPPVPLDAGLRDTGASFAAGCSSSRRASAAS